MNIVGIYKIVSPSGKVYIGQSWDIYRRWKDHKRNIKGKHKKLYSSLVSYGVEKHNFNILQTLPNDVNQSILNNYEQVYMDAYRDAGIVLLNIKEAGNYGKHSEETKQIIREKRALQVFSDEERKIKSIFFSTVKRTPEWNEKIAAKNRGRKYTYDVRLKLMKAVTQLSLNGDIIKYWDSARSAAKELNTTQSNICNCLTKRSKTAVGFKWCYSL